MVDVADFVPGGIRPADRWHIMTNDSTCSRCGELVSDHAVPLMLWDSSGDNMLVYFNRCLKVPASPDARKAGPQPTAMEATADRPDASTLPALPSRCPKTLGRPEPNAQGGPHPMMTTDGGQ